MLDLTYDTPAPKVIAGAKDDWELVIGMEVHAQVATQAKLFSGASTQFGAEPNSNVSFIDAGMPGMLPVINEACVAQAVRTGLGLKAEIHLNSAFDRKNYFYPDLPQGYQISQLYHPIVGEGEVLVEMGDGTARMVRIERIHLEQDAGKSIHDMDPALSFVDLNRTGVALMEIVSRPDIRGPEEAAAYLTKLRQIMLYLGTCDGNMQNGNLRADVNVSVCRPGQYEKYQETQDFSHLGTRCEIKNMNSMRFIQMAIDHEARRQIAILEAGGSIDQETRLYDPDKNETRSMRSKEEAHDYRYFPDPDLLPLQIEQAWVDDIASRPAGASRRQEIPLHRRFRPVGLRRLRPHRGLMSPPRSISKPWRPRPAMASSPPIWVINEPRFGRLKKDDQDIEAAPIAPTVPRPDHQADHIRHHLRQDRQGRLRDRLYLRPRPRRDRRDRGPQAGHRHRRHRGRRGRNHRRQSRSGRKGQTEPQARRLVRGPGHESHRRQGQPQSRQPDRERQARAMTRRRDPLSTHNERVKLRASFLNALASGFWASPSCARSSTARSALTS